MHNIVISDTSCLIILNKIGELDLLKNVYQRISTTETVAKEFGEELPEWVQIEKVRNLELQTILETQVDIGEASTLALAQEKASPLVLLDDLKARKLAQKLNLKFTGTLGVISKAKEMQVIDKIKPVLFKLHQTNFRISEKVVSELLKLHNER
jgi:predicted nucleic acid-binding protein